MPKATPAKTKSKAAAKTKTPAPVPKTRKRSRHSPFQRDSIAFRKSQTSTRELLPRAVLHDLIKAVATQVSDESTPLKIQSGFVEHMDGLLDQYMHSVLFPAGAFVRASGAKRLNERQLVTVVRYNKTSGKGPTWSDSEHNKIRSLIGLPAC